MKQNVKKNDFQKTIDQDVILKNVIFIFYFFAVSWFPKKGEESIQV